MKARNASPAIRLATVLLLLVIAIPAVPAATWAQGPAGEEGGIPSEVSVEEVHAEAAGLSRFRSFVLHGGYIARGVAMRNRGYGTIRITEGPGLNQIPKGATVYRAYLYWNLIARRSRASHTRGKINGHAIRGARIGTTTQPCWVSDAKSFSYRANVTPWVSGKGAYRLTGFASGRTDGTEPYSAPYNLPLLEGASLVVIYRKAAHPRTIVLLYDGAAETPLSATSRVTTISGFNAGGLVGPAKTTFIGADGQRNFAEPASTWNGHAIPQADWDGTDHQNGPDFSIGNLWDTDTARVGRYIEPWATSATVEVRGSPDCLVHVAQVFSISRGGFDSDGDALKDGWEANGYDHNGDGIVDVDLAAMGASPYHKDIFVEIDWMDGDHNHRPSYNVVRRLVNAFRKAPLGNPDGVRGIKIHLDRSNAVPHQTYVDPSAGCPNLWSRFDTIKNANFPAARWPIFHYVLFAHSLCPDTADTPWSKISGYSRGIPASDFIVSLGEWSSYGTDDARTGTLMHELGHNIGLTHGGRPGDHENYKPNHLSVMNYSFQASGLRRNSAWGLWDYQRWNLPPLDENSLDEREGLSGGAKISRYGTIWYCGRTAKLTNNANGQINWNCRSGIQTSVRANINRTTTGYSRFHVLRTLNEWARLRYDGGHVGGVMYPASLTQELSPLHELDYDTWLEISNLTLSEQ